MQVGSTVSFQLYEGMFNSHYYSVGKTRIALPKKRLKILNFLTFTILRIVTTKNRGSIDFGGIESIFESEWAHH